MIKLDHPWRLLRGIFALVSIAAFLAACAPPPPQHVDNICSVFQQYPDWYWSAMKTQKKWGVPVNTQLAIIYQESGFNGVAKPPRDRLLWVIPWKRPTTAYGYSQALESTWDNYQRTTNRHGADRTDFADASDFVGWYANRLHKKAGVKLWDSYNLYLAYHEGGGGYIRGTYKSKPWLMHVAMKVHDRSYLYGKQLPLCAAHIKKPWW